MIASPFFSRREMLRRTLQGFGYLAFAGLSSQAAAATARRPMFPAKAKRVIMLFMQGGVSHVDTFDYKPELNQEPWPGVQHEGQGEAVREPVEICATWAERPMGERAFPAHGRPRR